MSHSIISNNILKTIKAFDKKKYLSKRPKGMSDSEWNEYVKEFKTEKLVFLGKAPKSRAISSNKSNRDEE